MKIKNIHGLSRAEALLALNTLERTGRPGGLVCGHNMYLLSIHERHCDFHWQLQLLEHCLPIRMSATEGVDTKKNNCRSRLDQKYVPKQELDQKYIPQARGEQKTT